MNDPVAKRPGFFIDFKTGVMFFNLFNKKLSNVNGLFAGHFIDIRVFYVYQFNEVPCIGFISEMDITKAYRYLRDKYAGEIIVTYQHSFFEHAQKEIFFNNTVFVLKDKRMIELANNYCHVMHSSKQYNWGHKVMKDLSEFKQEISQANENKVIGFARSNQVN